MPHVNPAILSWARETAGLSIAEAAKKLDLKEARGVEAPARLVAYEAGQTIPSRSLLTKMAKQYRRPLVTFYMSAPPKKGDRGEDFRSLPDRSPSTEALVDALIRDVRARQSMVRSLFEDDEDAEPLRFVGSKKMGDGVAAVLAEVRRIVGVDLADFRAQASPEGAFALLRNGVEAAGIFVLLIGNLGSHHTAIDVEGFRGFALADELAPFIVINDQDATSAWTFTLLHELVHLLLGTTGVSGVFADRQIERFCNDVAGEFLLPTPEIPLVGVARDTDLEAAALRISNFAGERHLSRSMVAYRLMRAARLNEQSWNVLVRRFRDQWRQGRHARRERDRLKEGGPNYYVIRRHRLGAALLRFVSRSMSDGSLTPTKASKVLGVKARNVAPLLSGVTPAVGQVA